MQQYKNLHEGERCFILGNGPSLADVDLSRLEDEVTFGSNRIYLSGFIPNYYACVNPLVLAQFQDEIDAMETVKFLPNDPLDTSLREPMFSSPEGPIWEGHTVTYVLLQLAYYMGFDEVILLGVDHNYGEVLQPNMEVVATGADEHHFSSSYFSDGTRWHTPDLPMSEMAYSLAKFHYEKAGRKIINASGRTKLKVFPIVPINHVISQIKPRVSSICSAYYAADYMAGFLKDQTEQTETQEIVIVCQYGSEEHKMALDHREKFGYSWVTIIETEDVPTIYRAWNLGAQFARGKYLTNANTDDRHHPRAYELMANVLDARSDIDLVYHDSFVSWIPNQTFAQFIDDYKDVRLEAGRHEGNPGIFAWHNYDRELLARGCYMGPQPMWRANLHQKHGYFLDHYKIAGDYEFWLRISEDANMFRIGTPLGLYHASMNGAELSNPDLAAEEGFQAIHLHQSPGVDISPMPDGLLRFGIEGRWSYINANELYSMLKENLK
jgi:hypothetical protein